MGLLANHEIRIKSNRRTISLLTPNVAAKRGIAFQESATAGTAELADGTKKIAGLLTTDVAVGGPTLHEHVFSAARIELPVQGGHAASFEDFEELECENDHLDAAFISAVPAVGTELMFVAGVWKTATIGKLVAGIVAETGLTPNTAGNVRVRIRRMSEYPKQTANA